MQQLLLGLFFFSVLLATGNSLSCETCVSHSSDCSGSKVDCASKQDTCMTVTAESTLGAQKSQSTMKSCSTKDVCKSFEDLKGKASTSPISNIPVGSLIKQVVCSKASPAFASFFPAFLGLLLMKLLF
uniref:Gamma type PLA2 inhibitor n=1 Tax=Phalotris mertensi TaxID=1260334 RepID=A0A182C6F2_9SAUR